VKVDRNAQLIVAMSGAAGCAHVQILLTPEEKEINNHKAKSLLQRALKVLDEIEAMDKEN